MRMEVRVPTLGESITEATVGQWFKSVGDPIAQDETLLELETDKITVEVPAPVTGSLVDVAAESGATVNIGALLGRVEEGTGAIGGEAKPAAAPAEPAAARPKAAAAKPDLPLSPAVKKLIDEHNLDPAEIPGTGKDGRITKGDVLAFLETGPAASAPAAQTDLRPRADREERVRMTRLRQRISERLKQAQNTAAILTTYNEADMTEVMALRSEFRDDFERKHGVRLGFMSFFVKACVTALQEIPAVNGEIVGNEIIYKNYYDIGVAVGMPEGLVVPMIREADVLSFADLEKTIADLSVRARNGKLSLDELQGGTFSISNGGIFGSLMSSPILNPPQSGILGMHKIQKRPIVEGNDIVVRPMMYLALSYDHRIIDGREAVTFLVRVKECIENPKRLLLDL